MNNYANSQEIDYILQNNDIPDEIISDFLYKLYDVLEGKEDACRKEELEGLKQKLGFEVVKN